MARLVKPITLSQLTQDGFEFQIDTSQVEDGAPSSDEEDPAGLAERQDQSSNQECVGIFDEDVYEEGEPLEIIAKKMLNLVPDGKIKKRIIREGSGNKPLEYDTVTVNYNAYVEYEDKPFDSTYVRKKPLKFTVSDGKVIAGLDFAVQSMKLEEKSQFLIHSDYAYGSNIAIGRIPPSATVLFEVELLDILSSGAAVTYQKLPEVQQKQFEEVYKYCAAVCEKGKRAVACHNLKDAIKNYNTAISKLEKNILSSREEVEKQRELSLKVYTNLLICYTRLRESRKGCDNAKKIYDLTENGELLKIPAKVYYNHAKCLRLLSDYENAKTVLNKAYKLEPKNTEIANEMLNLERDRLEQRKKEVVLAKALVGEAST